MRSATPLSPPLRRAGLLFGQLRHRSHGSLPPVVTSGGELPPSPRAFGFTQLRFGGLRGTVRAGAPRPPHAPRCLTASAGTILSTRRANSPNEADLGVP